jgi:hypothetical protein
MKRSFERSPPTQANEASKRLKTNDGGGSTSASQRTFSVDVLPSTFNVWSNFARLLSASLLFWLWHLIGAIIKVVDWPFID